MRCAVIHRPASDTTSAAIATPTSSGSPTRPRAMCVPAPARNSSDFMKPPPKSVATGPGATTLTNLAGACGKIHQSYSDFVILAALLTARSSEVSGLQAGDVQFDKNNVVIARQTYPGKGGLVTKQTKSRRERRVSILDPLRPVPERLMKGMEPEERLLVGPKGGALTTATVRDATNWDQIVSDLGLPDLTRHGLRRTGAIWMADAGIPLHTPGHPRPPLRPDRRADTCTPTTVTSHQPQSRRTPSSPARPRPPVHLTAGLRGRCMIRPVFRSYRASWETGVPKGVSRPA